MPAIHSTIGDAIAYTPDYTHTHYDADGQPITHDHSYGYWHSYPHAHAHPDGDGEPVADPDTIGDTINPEPETLPDSIVESIIDHARDAYSNPNPIRAISVGPYPAESDTINHAVALTVARTESGADAIIADDRARGALHHAYARWLDSDRADIDPDG